MRITLRSGKRDVPEQLLHRSEVRSTFEKVGGTTVTERMRSHSSEPDAEGGAFDDRAGAADAETAAASVEEHRAGPLGDAASGARGCKGRASLGQVFAERVDGGLTERHDALLSTLSEQPHLALAEIEATQVEFARFCHAGSAAVEQLEQRAISQPGRGGKIGSSQERSDLVGA